MHSFVFIYFGDFNVDVSVPGYLCNVANLHALTIITSGHNVSMTMHIVTSNAQTTLQHEHTIAKLATTFDHGCMYSLKRI